MTAAERVCLGSLLLEQGVQMHWLCSFWGVTFAMTACDGWGSYLCYRRGFYTGALWFLVFVFKEACVSLLQATAAQCFFVSAQSRGFYYL